MGIHSKLHFVRHLRTDRLTEQKESLTSELLITTPRTSLSYVAQLKRCRWVGFNIVWSVLYERSEYKTLQTMLKLAISPGPTFRPPASWSQPDTSMTHWTTQFHSAASWFCCLRAPWAGVVNRAKDCWRIHVGMWIAGRCFGVKLWKSRNYFRYFVSFNLFAVNKDILYFVE